MKEVIESAVRELKRIISNYVKPGVNPPYVLKDNLFFENPKDKGLVEALINITNDMSESLSKNDNNSLRFKNDFAKLNSEVEVRIKEKYVSTGMFGLGAGEYSELQNKTMAMLTFVTKLKDDNARTTAEEERKREAEEERRRQLVLEEAKLKAQEEANKIAREQLALERTRVQSDQEKNSLLSVIKNLQEENKKQGDELTQLRTIMTQMQSQLGSQRGDAPDPWKHLSHLQPNGNSFHQPAASAIDVEIEFLTKRIGTHHTQLVRQLGILANTKIAAFVDVVNSIIEKILINFEKPQIQGISSELSKITYNDVREPLIKEALGKIFTLEKAELANPKLHDDAMASILKKEQNDLTQIQNAEIEKAKKENRPAANYSHLTPESQVVHKLAQFVSGEAYKGRKPIIFPEISGLHQKLLAKKQEIIDLKKAQLPKATAPAVTK